MTYETKCGGCGGSFLAKRPHAHYCSDACRARAWKGEGGSSGERGAERVPEHPLDEVRAQRAAKKHNRDLGGLIRQAIVDQIKTTGECFPDDLVPLYPEDEVKLCRRLATAQFGTMTGAGLIREKERRKSTFGSRKGAKIGVYVFTEKGWAEFAGVGAGVELSKGAPTSSLRDVRSPSVDPGAEPATNEHPAPTPPTSVPGASSELLTLPVDEAGAREHTSAFTGPSEVAA